MSRATREYHDDSQPALLILFDTRIPGAVESFHHQRWAWVDAGDVEALDEDHYVLIVQSGAARRLAR